MATSISLPIGALPPASSAHRVRERLTVWQLVQKIAVQILEGIREGFWSLIAWGQTSYEVREWAVFRVGEYFWQIPALRLEGYWLRFRGWVNASTASLQREALESEAEVLRQRLASLTLRLEEFEHSQQKSQTDHQESERNQRVEQGGLVVQRDALCGSLALSNAEIEVLRQRLARAREAASVRIEMASPRPLDEMLATAHQLLEQIKTTTRDLNDLHQSEAGIASLQGLVEALESTILTVLAQRQGEILVQRTAITDGEAGGV